MILCNFKLRIMRFWMQFTLKLPFGGRVVLSQLQSLKSSWYQVNEETFVNLNGREFLILLMLDTEVLKPNLLLSIPCVRKYGIVQCILYFGVN